MKNNNDKNVTNVASIAILVTFLSTFISLTVSFIIISIRNGVIHNAVFDLNKITQVDFWIIFMIFLLIIRHHLRVIFLDTVYNKLIEKSYDKIVTWLLLLIATMGSVIFLILGFGVTVAALYMLIYSFLFTILGAFMLAGRVTGPEEPNKLRDPKNLYAIWSLFIDVVCISLWTLIASRGESLQGLFFACIVILGMISEEFYLIFKNPFIKRFNEFKVLIKN